MVIIWMYIYVYPPRTCRFFGVSTQGNPSTPPPTTPWLPKAEPLLESTVSSSRFAWDAKSAWIMAPSLYWAAICKAVSPTYVHGKICKKKTTFKTKPRNDVFLFCVCACVCVCVCVCVWKHLGTHGEMIFQQFLQQGGWERVGGGLRPTKTPPPPHPVQTYLHFPFFRWIAGAKLRTLSIYFPGTTTTGLFLRWWAILGPCYIYFKWWPTSYRCPTSHYTRQPCRTLISVCQSSGCYVIPAGWTFREGPGQKTTS